MTGLLAVGIHGLSELLHFLIFSIGNSGRFIEIYINVGYNAN